MVMVLSNPHQRGSVDNMVRVLSNLKIFGRPGQRGSLDNGDGDGFKQPGDIRGSQVWLQQDQMWRLPQPPSGGISTW